MKCPMCNGSGKCYEQKIRYQEIETNRTDFTLAKCHKCNGTGEVQMTNEEWLHTLNTEQLADVLNKMTLSCYICGQDGVREDTRHCVFGKCTGKEDILVWLKQPYSEVGK